MNDIDSEVADWQRNYLGRQWHWLDVLAVLMFLAMSASQ